MHKYTLDTAKMPGKFTLMERPTGHFKERSGNCDPMEKRCMVARTW